MHMPVMSEMFSQLVNLSSIPDIPAPIITIVALVKFLFPTGRRVLTEEAIMVDVDIEVKDAARRGFKLPKSRAERCI
jgi:hypothetical protein